MDSDLRTKLEALASELDTNIADFSFNVREADAADDMDNALWYGGCRLTAQLIVARLRQLLAEDAADNG